MFANAAVLVFLTKFLLNRLGPDRFGMFRYVVTIQGSLLFLDLGLGATLNRFVSRLLALKDMGRLNAAISFTSLLFFGLGIIAGLTMTSIGFILPSLVLGCTDELYARGLLLMACMGATLATRFWGYAPRGVLFGAQRYDVVNIVQSGTAILRAVTIVILFLMTESAGLVTIGLCFLACAVVDTSLMWMFARRQLPSLRLGLRTIERSVVKEVVGFSVWLTIMAITTMLIVNAPTFFAGRLYGPQEVALVSLSLLVLSQLQRISGGFAFSLIPVAGTRGALEDEAGLRQIVVRGTKYCAMMCFPVGVTAVIFGRPLFEWFEKGFGWTWVLLAIMMLPMLVRTTQRVTFSVLDGSH
jgi:O-antigen/teichoic acid export membrane protein